MFYLVPAQKASSFEDLDIFGLLPVGLNLVARVRLEYPPPTMELFLVIAHVFFISSCYHRIYMDATNAIFYIAILIMSVVIHEVSHGFMAEYFGDDTARDAGRLTLNPIQSPRYFRLGSFAGGFGLGAFSVFIRLGETGALQSE